MIKEQSFKVYYEGNYTNFTFEFDRPSSVDVRFVVASDYGDANYRRFGIVSGAWIYYYYVFEIMNYRKEKVYLVAEEFFWGDDYEDAVYEFEFDTYKITVKARLNRPYFRVFTEEELDQWFERIDNFY